MSDLVTGKTYKFKTLQDVYNVVPLDRIRECLGEMGELFEFMKLFIEILNESHKKKCISNGTVFEPIIVSLPEEMEWIDDGHQDISFVLNGEKINRSDFYRSVFKELDNKRNLQKGAAENEKPD